MTRGSVTSARATASICCSPPESCEPLLRRRSASAGNNPNRRSIGPKPRRNALGDLDVLDHGQVRKDHPAFRNIAHADAHDAVRRPAGDILAGKQDVAGAAAA